MNFHANKTYFQKDLASILNREFLELGNRPVGLDSIETRSDDVTKTTLMKFCVG